MYLMRSSDDIFSALTSDASAGLKSHKNHSYCKEIKTASSGCLTRAIKDIMKKSQDFR